MQTVYDWVTVGVFAGLITLFLQRSSADEPRDKILHYLPAAVGCAIANYLGNEGYDIVAVGVIALIIGYVWYVLKPLAR